MSSSSPPSPLSLPCIFPILLSFLSQSHGSGGAELEPDDEPPCTEEIDYSLDNSSDPLEILSELDRQIQACAWPEDEEAQGEDGAPWHSGGAGL